MDSLQMSIKRSTSAIKRSLYSGPFTLREGEAGFYLLILNGKGFLACILHAPWLLPSRSEAINHEKHLIGLHIFREFINLHTCTHTDHEQDYQWCVSIVRLKLYLWLVSFPDCIFCVRPPEKRVWWAAYSVFVQVCQNANAGTLFFSNLTLDVIAC